MASTRQHFDSMRAKDAMTRDVVTVYANQQMSTAGQVLRERCISGAPVVTFDETCVGVLSCKDFLKREAVTAVDDQVFQHMSAPVVWVSESHTLLEVAAIMRSYRIHRVPVIDARGHVMGILSTLDLVDQLLQTIEPHARAKGRSVRLGRER